MTSLTLKGINGTNPLGFMAAVGLLRLLYLKHDRVRLGFTTDGAFHARIDGGLTLERVVDIVTDDATTSAAASQPWLLKYNKEEKKGNKTVADLKAPPEQFSKFLLLSVEEWLIGNPERSEYAAAYGTDVARDGKGNVKPTAFHFTAANQQFLGAVQETRSKITPDWVKSSLNDYPDSTRSGTNLRWDPNAERSRALMSENPNDAGTVVNAPLEWLAFRSLPAFRCVPIGSRIVTSGVTGRRQDDLFFRWPLWSCGASYVAARSLIACSTNWSSTKDQSSRGVFAMCTSQICRTAQGFGNFSPAQVSS